MLACVATVTGTAIPGLFQEGYPLAPFSGAANVFIGKHPYAFLVIFAVSLAFSVLTDGTLVLVFSGKRSPQAWRDSFTVLAKMMTLWGAFAVSAVVIVFVLLLPSSLVSGNTSSTLYRPLLLSGILIFIPVLTILAFTREFAAYHVLLSRTSLSASMRLGYALFTIRIRESILFCISLILYVLSTSLVIDAVNYAMRNVIHTSDATVLAAESAFLLFFQSYAYAASRSARLSFFLRINATPEDRATSDASQKEEKVIQKEVPEVS
ncbi:MAG TPA: hypothetical protein VN420_02015 [Candidatus Fimivivens sp.]|nr:hypothetical protein [Candidatus Fimivivens sp.]